MPAKGTSPEPHGFILRVGVTGHRMKDLQKMDRDQIDQKLNEIFTKLKGVIQSLPKQQDGLEHGLQILSPLADGADQIVASIAQKSGYKLYCPLPFFKPGSPTDAEKIYGENVNKPGDEEPVIFEMDGSTEKEEQAYEAAGLMVLRHSDVLVAIWNGQEPRGAGGTGHIVKEAEKFSIPIVQVNPDKPHDVVYRRPKSKNERQKDKNDPIEKEKIFKDVDETDFHAAVALRILPPKEEDPHEIAHHATKVVDLRSMYFSEKIPSWNFAVLWKLFNKVFGYDRSLKKIKDQPKDWTASIQSIENISPAAREELTKVIENIQQKVRPHYEFADALAGYYTNLYHSGFIWNYLMSALAVLFAFLAFVLHKHALGFAELFAIASIIVVYLFDRSRKWYDRRIDYRLLAELLRQTRFLAAIGRIPPLAAPEPIHTHYEDPSSSWVHWHFSGVAKHIGLPNTKLTQDYLKAVAGLIQQETKHQAAYHFRKATWNGNIHHRLHLLAFGMFILAAIGCGLHVLKDLPFVYSNTSIRPYLNDFPQLGTAFSLLSIVCPAFGAAFAGILSQGEFQRVGRHNVAMAEYLDEKYVDLETFRNKSTVDSASLAQIVDDISEKMIDEILDWRIVFHKRPIELG